jgi:DNA-binding response OmpR family regulator
MILRARVHARLRNGPPPAPIRYNSTASVFFHQNGVTKDGGIRELSKTEQKLLRKLLENRGHTLTRAQLVDAVWTDGSEYVDENALSVTVNACATSWKIRRPLPGTFKTVDGIGYTWAVT